jgi:hypothetical protein
MEDNEPDMAAAETTHGTEEQSINVGALITAMDETYVRLDSIISVLGPSLDAGPDAGGWTARQVLSHLIGAWQRIPLHAAFFLDSSFTGEVPIQFHGDYWIPEWETAPLHAFAAAMEAAYTGARAFVQDLSPVALNRRARTPFGEQTLGELLMGSISGHISDFHTPQLEAFVV